MLNQLTNYLLGSEQNSSSAAKKADLPQNDENATKSAMTESKAEPEFLLVRNASPDGSQQNEDGWVLLDAKEMLIDLEKCEFPTKSENGSRTPSTPRSAWNITPPACFDKTNDIESGVLETSNFENLLIEHPSKSVYRSIQASVKDESCEDLVRVQRREISIAEFLPPTFWDQIAGKKDSSDLWCRAKSLGPNQLNRGNRVVENNASASKPGSQRKKRMRKFSSGKNNDRKCQ